MDQNKPQSLPNFPLNWQMDNGIAMIPHSRVNINTSDINVPEQNLNEQPKDLLELWNSLPGSPIKDQPLIITPHEQNRRYGSETLLFNPMRDNEEFYAKSQGALKNLGHGALKMVGYAGSTFID